MPVRIRVFLYLALFLSVLLGVLVGLGYVFSNIIGYIVVSLIIATILRPTVERLTSLQLFSLRFPKVPAILIAFSGFITVILLFLRLFIPLITGELSKLAEIDYKMILSQATHYLKGLESFLIKNNLVDEQEGFILEKSGSYALDFLQGFEFSTLINNAFSFLGSVLISLLAISFISFFFLLEKGLMRKLFLKLIPNSFFELTITAFYKIEKLLSNYLTGLLLQMLAIFSLASILLTIAGIDYAFTIAVFAAAANLIPYLGPILGASFGVIIAVSTSGMYTDVQGVFLILAKLGVVFGIVQIADNIIFQPIIFSKSVKAHPVEIFVIVFVGATLAGPLGMIFAIPAYTIVRVSLIEFYLGYQEYKIFNLNQNR